MTVESARLDAESLKELVRLAEHRVCVHPEDGWAQDFTDNVPALIDALESAQAKLAAFEDRSGWCICGSNADEAAYRCRNIPEPGEIECYFCREADDHANEAARLQRERDAS